MRELYLIAADLVLLVRGPDSPAFRWCIRRAAAAEGF